MRLPKTLPTLVLLLMVPAFARSQAGDSAPIDALIQTVIEKRKGLEDAKKAAATAEAELKKAVEDLNKRLADLGLNGPVVPPGPGPGPGPGPVVPPTDPLAAKLWAAYRADTSATKAEALKDFVELFRQAQTLADDPTLTTVGGLAGKVAAAAATLAKDQLPGVRAVLKVELATAFPDDGPLTATVRAGAKATFLKLQTALTEAGK